MSRKGALALLADYGDTSSDDEVPERTHKDNEEEEPQSKRLETLPSTSTTPRMRRKQRSGAAKRRAKKARLAAGSSGAPATSTHTVCVFGEGFPLRQLTPAEGTALVRRIEEVLFRTAGELAASGHIPAFSGYQIREGALYVNCDDQQSREWLGVVVNDLQFRLTSVSEISTPRRAIVHVKGPQEEPNVVLQHLEVLNPGLGSTGWLVYGSERVGSSVTRLAVGLWAPSVEALQACDFRPHYGLGRARVRLRSGSG